MGTVVWSLVVLPDDFEIDKDKTDKNTVLVYNNGDKPNRLFVPVQISRGKDFNKSREEIINIVNNVFDKTESF
jgi:hypothetical protein